MCEFLALVEDLRNSRPTEAPGLVRPGCDWVRDWARAKFVRELQGRGRNKSALLEDWERWANHVDVHELEVGGRSSGEVEERDLVLDSVILISDTIVGGSLFCSSERMKKRGVLMCRSLNI